MQADPGELTKSPIKEDKLPENFISFFIVISQTLPTELPPRSSDQPFFVLSRLSVSQLSTFFEDF